MNGLIRGLVVVLLPLGVLSAAFEWRARTMPTSYGVKDAGLAAMRERVEVLVTGSSHAYVGINPRLLGREAFNLADISQDVYYDHRLLMKCLPSCPNVRLVVMPVSYLTLQYDLALSLASWRTGCYSIYLGIPPRRLAYRFPVQHWSALAMWRGPLGVVQQIRAFRRDEKINAYGYRSLGTQEIGRGEGIDGGGGLSRVAYHHSMMDRRLIRGNLAIIDSIAEELGRRRIGLVFVTLPVDASYREEMSPANYNLMAGNVRALSRRYAVPYYNYFSDERFESRDFADEDHLNDRGAAKFSAILKNEVIDPLLSASPPVPR